MATLKGTTAPTGTIMLRGVQINIKKVPFGKLKEFQTIAETLQEDDEDSLEFIKKIIIDYTDLEVTDDYDPFGNTDDALTFAETEELFRAILSSGKKN